MFSIFFSFLIPLSVGAPIGPQNTQGPRSKPPSMWDIGGLYNNGESAMVDFTTLQSDLVHLHLGSGKPPNRRRNRRLEEYFRWKKPASDSFSQNKDGLAGAIASAQAGSMLAGANAEAKAVFGKLGDAQHYGVGAKSKAGVSLGGVNGNVGAGVGAQVKGASIEAGASVGVDGNFANGKNCKYQITK